MTLLTSHPLLLPIIFLLFQGFFINPSHGQSSTHTITTTWNSTQLPVNATVTISLTPTQDPDGWPSLLFRITFSPLYNDPLPPQAPPEEPFPGLWDYEVVELFLLGDNNEYLEVELSPSSHYIALYLKGYRNDTGMYLPLRHVTTSVINSTDDQLPTWRGEIHIPGHYLPCNISKFNSYAIHGSDPDRVYLSLFPVLAGELPGPDFHHLPAFQAIPFDTEINPLCSSYDHTIATLWDGTPVENKWMLSFSVIPGEGVRIQVNAPYFNDPPAPEGPTDDPFPGLWEYEVVELFFLGEGDEYLEIELSPSGHYLLLYLNGYRNDTGRVLPLDGYRVKDVNTTEDSRVQRWIGEVTIPGEYFPCNVTKFNAYAIHGSDEEREYLSLFPVLGGELDQPDFHYLPAFGSVDLGGEVNGGCGIVSTTETTVTQATTTPVTVTQPATTATTVTEATTDSGCDAIKMAWISLVVGVFVSRL